MSLGSRIKHWFRFSLRTLLMLVLLIGSAVTLRWRWEPWALERSLNLTGQCIPRVTYGGKLLAVWSNGTQFLYDADTFASRKEFPKQIYAGDSPQLGLIAVRDDNRAQSLFLLRADDFETKFQLRPEGNARFWRALFTADSVLTYGRDGAPVVWDVTNGTEKFRLGKAEDEGFLRVAISPDAQLVATAGVGNDVVLWALHSGRELHRLSGHTQTVNSLAFSPDGIWVISGSQDNSARIWNAQTGELVAALRGHEDLSTDRVFPGVQRAGFTPDQKTFVTQTAHSVSLWDAQHKFALLRTIAIDQVAGITDISIQSQRILAQTDDAKGGGMVLALYDLATGDLLYTLPTTSPWINTGFFLSDDRIIIGTNDGQVQLWRRRRPEYRWAVVVLPEFWLTLLFSIGLIWSVWRDRRRLAR